MSFFDIFNSKIEIVRSKNKLKDDIQDLEDEIEGLEEQLENEEDKNGELRRELRIVRAEHEARKSILEEEKQAAVEREKVKRKSKVKEVREEADHKVTQLENQAEERADEKIRNMRNELETEYEEKFEELREDRGAALELAAEKEARAEEREIRIEDLRGDKEDLVELVQFMGTYIPDTEGVIEAAKQELGDFDIKLQVPESNVTVNNGSD